MELWTIVIGVGAVVGIIAGVVTVLDYIQKRRERSAPGQNRQQPTSVTAPQVAQLSGYQSGDAYSTYEAGMGQLLDRLGRGHPRYAEALVYQQRLIENIAETRRYGDTGMQEAERSQIIEQLNDVALSVLGIPFNELCAQVPHNLPPQSEFIGREAEKAQLHEALCSRSPLVSIDGIGGIGKTALALEVAYACLYASQGKAPTDGIATFDGFIWTTAKDRDLTLNDILGTVARILEYPGIAQKPIEEKQLAIRKLLRTKSYLLIVDNFETITDDSVLGFLLKLPEPSKVLITTREKKLLDTIMFSLEDLKEAEALALIRSMGKRLGLPTVEHAEDRMLLPLCQATGGAPLAIKWAVGQIKQKGQSLDTVLAALHGAKASIFDRIFARSWELLSADARQVLIVMPIFATSASREGIEAASDVHAPALDEAIGQLVEMSLVDIIGEPDLNQQRCSIHPLTRAFAGAKLMEEPETQYAAYHRFAQFLQTFTGEYGGHWTQEGVDRLEPELPNILELIQWCWKQRLDSLAMNIFFSVGNVLISCGYWDNAMSLGQEALAMVNEPRDKPNAEVFRVWPVGWLHRHRGDLDFAEAEITQALTVFESLDEEEVTWTLAMPERFGAEWCVALAKRHLGRIAQKRGRLEQAEQLLREALDFYQSTGEEHHLSLTRINLGRVALQQGDLESAWRLSNKALKPARQLDYPNLISQALDLSGEVMRQRGNLEKAKELWDESLDHLKRINRLDGIADKLFSLAQIEIETGNIQAARQKLCDALDTYQRLDIQPKVQEVESLLSELPEPRDQTDQEGGHQLNGD